MVVFTGKTVEEAIDNGLKELNISRLKARIKVISREKKGFLGFGRKLAQVDVEAIDEVAISRAQKVVKESEVDLNPKEMIVSEEKETVAQEESLSVEQDVQTLVFEEVSEESSLPGKTIEEAVKEVIAYVQSIIYEMDIEASIEATNNRRHINLQIETPDAGRVIGYHGKVLKSLQLLAQNFLHDRYSKHFSVSLNVHDYLEQRTEVLIDFTHKIANRVIDSGRPYVMDPMSNSERKIIHKTIASIDEVVSYSEGNDPNRYVVVVPASFEEEND